MSRALLVAVAAAVAVVAVPSSPLPAQELSDPILRAMAAGEAAATTRGTPMPWGFGFVVGGVPAAFAGHTSQGEALGYAALVGLGYAALTYVTGSRATEPPEEVLAEAGGSADYREAFRRGYRDQMSGRVARNALLAGFVTAATYAIVAVATLDDEEEDGGVIVTLLRVPTR